MSFILDALRKSEHARQKQIGPALADVPVVAARPKSNVWATAAIALLVVNLVAIGIVLLGRSRDGDSQAVAPPPETVAKPPTVETNATARRAPPPPMLRPAAEGARAKPGRNALRDEIVPAAPRPAAASEPPSGPPAVRVTPARAGTVTYQALTDLEESRNGPGAVQPASEQLPRLDEIPSQGGLPDLQLQLHVYSTEPRERFVFINGQKYTDGDTLREGPLVEQITSDGVVLSRNGHRFMLAKD